MARGSFWDELGRDRERRRRAEAVRLRAEAQIRKDERRAATGSRRDQAAQERADRDAEAAALQADLETRVTERVDATFEDGPRRGGRDGADD